MKVLVSVTEVITYEIQKEIEMTKKEYLNYLKTGKYNPEIEHEVTSDIDAEHWVNTKSWIDDIIEVQ
jgi:hypothetical protein